MNAVTFVGFDFIFELNATKIVICPQIVPNYPEIISILLNLISFVVIYNILIYSGICGF